MRCRHGRQLPGFCRPYADAMGHRVMAMLKIISLVDHEVMAARKAAEADLHAVASLLRNDINTLIERLVDAETKILKLRRDVDQILHL
jgi:hypothetical protein